MIYCRVCGEEKSRLDLNIELEDKTNSSWTYRELIEHHTRVSLKKNKLLPQSVCEECWTYIEAFSEFSSKLQEVQDSLESNRDPENGDFERSLVQECFVKIEPIDKNVLLRAKKVYATRKRKREKVSESDASSEDSRDFASDFERDELPTTSTELSKTTKAAKSKRKKTSKLQTEKYTTVEALYKEELKKSFVPKVHLDVSEKLKDGEVLKAHLQHVSKVRWSAVVKECSLCNDPVTNLLDLMEHCRSEHSSIEEDVNLSCLFCTNKFKQIYSLMNHLLFKHPQTEHLRFCCLVCNKMYYNLPLLFMHVKSSHLSTLNSINQCLICGYYGGNFSCLKVHQKTHLTDEPENVTKLHEKMQESILPEVTLAIEDCYKNEDGSVAEARQDFHKKWSEFKTSCDVCETEYEPIEYHHHHMNDHIDRGNGLPYKFQCSQCPEDTFGSLATFHTHLTSKHHEELSFSCIVCSKMFWNHAAVFNHIEKFHPSFRQFFCMLCGKLMERLDHYQNHLAYVHGHGEKLKPVVRKRAKRQPKMSDQQQIKKTVAKKLQDNRSFDEIFANELDYSQHPDLHLDVQNEHVSETGEVTKAENLSSARWKNMLASCDKCDASLTIIELKQHFEKVHNLRDIRTSCLMCSAKFKKMCSFANHVLGKHLEFEHLRYCCAVCDKLFYTVPLLHRHITTSHKKESRLICLCLQCGNYSENIQTIKSHARTHDKVYSDDVAKFYTNIEKSDDLAQHRIVLAIDDCFKNDDGSVASEAQSKFREWNDYKVSCKLCSLHDLTPVQYHMHHQNEHGETYESGHLKNIWSFVCEECPSEVFTSISTFHSHKVKNHSKELGFRCILCSKMYWNHSALFYHIKYRHPSFKQFFCILCGVMSEKISQFRIHLTSVHGLCDKVGPRNHGKNKNSELSLNNDAGGSSKMPVEAGENLQQLKFETVAIKHEVDSEQVDFEDSGSEDKAESSSDEEFDVLGKSKKQRERNVGEEAASESTRVKNQQLYGEEIDSVEKLFEDEMNKTSKFYTRLHLNISESLKSPNGEVPERFAQRVSTLRWKDILSCVICKTSFVNADELTKHAKENHSKKLRSFNCFQCEGRQSARNIEALVNHLVDRHYHEHLKFCCLVCSKMFYDFSSLLIHHKTHGGESEFQLLVCFICGFYAKTLDDLKEHKAYHLSKRIDTQLICHRVQEKFKSGALPIMKVNEMVAENERNPDGTVTDECQQRLAVSWNFGSFHCSSCVIDFSTPFELFAHNRAMHLRNDTKVFKCTLCVSGREKLNSMYAFINHSISRNHHESLKTSCIICSKVFWNSLALSSHYREVHSSFPCVFCNHCGMFFLNSGIALRHFNKEGLNMNEKNTKKDDNFICHICARTFKSRGPWKAHCKVHETVDPAEMLQCQICNKLLKNKFVLKRHMIVHENKREWKCHICGAGFNFNGLLQSHIESIHENLRKFACPFCDKRFNQRYDLTIHKRLHTREYPYECSVAGCTEKYPAWGNLFKHCQSRHKMDIRSEDYKTRQSIKQTGADSDSSD